MSVGKEDKTQIASERERGEANEGEDKNEDGKKEEGEPLGVIADRFHCLKTSHQQKKDDLNYQ